MKLVTSYGLLLAFFGSVFTVIMFTKGVPLIGAGLSSIISAMQLPVTMLLSVIILHDSMSGSQVIGIIVILLGISMPEFIKTKTQNQPDVAKRKLS